MKCSLDFKHLFSNHRIRLLHSCGESVSQFSFFKVDSSSRRLLVIGCGSVSQCTLPLLIDFFLLKQRIGSITILDALDRRARIQSSLVEHDRIHYRQEWITPGNYDTILHRYLSPGDILLDLAYNLETRCLLQWCHDHEVCFVNTSVELWNPYGEAGGQDSRLLTLYHRQMQLLELQRQPRWKKNGPTAIIDHGCNPGLVSHFIKRALLNMADYVLNEHEPLVAPNERIPLETAAKAKDYAQLAYLLGIKVIHISERDTQISGDPKKVDEFVNTWSIDGLAEEAVAPAEMGWGTHERSIPDGACFHKGDDGPCNQICLSTKGMNTWVNPRRSRSHCIFDRARL